MRSPIIAFLCSIPATAMAQPEDRWPLPLAAERAYGIGQFDRSLDILTEELRSCEAAEPAADECLDLVMQSLRIAMKARDRNRFAALARKALEIRDAAVPPEHPDRREIDWRIGYGWFELEEWNAAETAFERRVEHILRFAPDETHVLSVAWQYLGIVREAQGYYGRAEYALRQTLILAKASGAPPDTLLDLELDLAGNLSRQGKHEEAERAGRRSLTVALRDFADRPDTLRHAYSQVAFILDRADKLAEAEQIYRRAIETKGIDRSTYGYATMVSNYAFNLNAQGKFRAGETYARLAAHLMRARVGPRHVNLAGAVTILSAALEGQGKVAEATACAKIAWQLRTADGRQEDPLWIRGNLMFGEYLLRNSGDLALARSLLNDASVGVAQRLATWTDFNPQSALELSRYRPVYVAKVQASWRLENGTPRTPQPRTVDARPVPTARTFSCAEPGAS